MGERKKTGLVRGWSAAAVEVRWKPVAKKLGKSVAGPQQTVAFRRKNAKDIAIQASTNGTRYDARM